MPKLPEDLIVEIISRLPVKSLIRFKCVCKTWQSIISDPKFAKLQFASSNDNNNQKILLTTWLPSPPQSVNYEAYNNGDTITTAVRKLSYPSILSSGKDSYIGILGSCNGLVCLLDEINMLMLLWNPTTGDYKQLPNPNGAFHGAFLHGVGYNYDSDDYGVLFGSHFTTNDAKETIMELYSLKKGTWRRIQDIDSINEWFEESGISWNGNLYWVSRNGIGVMVVCFDMVEKKFKDVLPLTDYLDPKIFTLSLAVSGKCLCVFSEQRGSSFECLVLKIKGGEVCCMKLFSFPHDRFPGYGDVPLCLTKNGDVVMESDGWQIYLYNPKQGEIDQNSLLQNESESESKLYVESLISPNN